MKKVLTTLLTISLSVLAASPVIAESFQGVNYTVIEKSNFGSMQSRIDLRLDKKVSKDYLRKLALRLQEAEPRTYERIFINYYLPGMTPGSGAWATSHFNPNLEVKILGTTIAEEKALRVDSKDSPVGVIGKWLDESPYVGAVYTFLRRNGKIIMVRKSKDRSSSEREMIQKKQSGLLRFEEKVGRRNGEYFLVERNGNLSIYDNIGLIVTMRSVK